MNKLTSITRASIARALDLIIPTRITTVRAFDPNGCRFEITSRVEAFRVERFGGEEEFVRQILGAVGPGDVLFDIGACVGLISIHAAKKGARVVSFEPDPEYAIRLKTNLALNSISVEHVSWAVSDRDGKATLFTDGAGGASPSLRDLGRKGQVTVPTRAIDAALAAGEIPFPDVVKMDIEGAEILALRGMRGLLHSPRAPRVIFLELHPEFLPAFGASSDDVLALLRDAGYMIEHEARRQDQQHLAFRRRTQT